jgi:lysozyme family protein
MTAANFDPALDFTWGPSRDGSADDSAPGETFRTSWGITQATWDDAVADGIVTGALADATREQCAAIFRVRYWNACRCSALPPGIDAMVFDAAVLTGAGHAARMLQQVLGVAVDGAIGPQTLRAVGARVAKDLIDGYRAAGVAYLASLPRAPEFIRGWTAREDAVKALAYQLARINVPHFTPAA